MHRRYNVTNASALLEIVLWVDRIADVFADDSLALLEKADVRAVVLFSLLEKRRVDGLGWFTHVLLILSSVRRGGFVWLLLSCLTFSVEAVNALAAHFWYL